MKEIYGIFEAIIKNTRLKTSFLAGCVMTLLAHAYGFFNTSFMNDRIAFFRDPDFDFASTGKWFAEVVSGLRYYSYLPWLIGVLEMIFVSVSVYATIEVLKINRTLSIWIVAGLYVTNVSFIIGNFYSGDTFSFALVMAALSAWFWSLKENEGKNAVTDAFRRHFSLRLIFGAVTTALSLAVYGSYASVAPTLILLGAMALWFQGKKSGYIMKRVGEYVITYGAGMVIYYVILRIVLKVRNIEMLSYMGEDRLVHGASAKEILSFAGMAYENPIKHWLGMDGLNTIPARVSIIILIVAVILFFIQLVYHRELLRDPARAIVLLILALIFPFSAGLICVMAFGSVHYLMIFTYVLLYVGVVKLAESSLFSTQKKFQRVILRTIVTVEVILLGATIYRGAILSNMTYSALELSYTASKSIATRLMDRIEGCEGAYGEEMVVFIGDLADNEYFRRPPEVGQYWRSKIGFLGLPVYSTSFAYLGNTRSFLQDVMGFYRSIAYYIPGSGSGAYTEEDEEMIASMPVFPADGSVRKIGETIVVRLSE